MLEPRLILIHLLIKLGVAATVSTVLGRSKEFRKLLFREHRSTKDKIYLALWMGLPIALGVWIRFNVTSFISGDLALETGDIRPTSRLVFPTENAFTFDYDRNTFSSKTR